VGCGRLARQTRGSCTQRRTMVTSGGSLDQRISGGGRSHGRAEAKQTTAGNVAQRPAPSAQKQINKNALGTSDFGLPRPSELPSTTYHPPPPSAIRHPFVLCVLPFYLLFFYSDCLFLFGITDHVSVYIEHCTLYIIFCVTCHCTSFIVYCLLPVIIMSRSSFIVYLYL
jgi:hypothetical protein